MNYQRNWTAGERRKFAKSMRENGPTILIGLSLIRAILPVFALFALAGLLAHFAAQPHQAYGGLALLGLGMGTAVVEQKDIEELKTKIAGDIGTLRENLGKFTEDAQKQIKATGAMAEETKTNLDKTLAEIGELKGHMRALEQKVTAPVGGDQVEEKSLGQIVVESEDFKSFADRGKGSLVVKIPSKAWRSASKTAIVNATGLNQPLVMPDRLQRIIAPQLQRLRIRDLLNSVPTSSNMVEFTKETSHTLAAAPQGKGSSPQVYENIAKAESALGFALENEPVQTIAHWIPASKQVLADAPQLQGYIDGRLRYGLKLEEEKQLLTGAGSGGDLNGLITQATSYDTSLDQAGDTKIDTLRRVLLQAQLAFFDVSAIVLNPEDWTDIELKKDTQKRYIYGSPSGLLAPSIWSLPVVSTPAVDKGDFLAGDFSSNVCDIYDREQVSVTISTEHSDFFTRNMVAILCEERIALVVYKPDGLISGSYPASA